MKNFFANRNLVRLIDEIAQKYGKLPSEVMNTSIEDFNFNVAIKAIIDIEASKPIEQPISKDDEKLSKIFQIKKVKKKQT